MAWVSGAAVLGTGTVFGILLFSGSAYDGSPTDHELSIVL
jgi:hypothetical protein